MFSIFDDIASVELSLNSTSRLNFPWFAERYASISRSSRVSVLFINTLLVIELLLLRSLSVIDVVAINNIRENSKLRTI